MNSQFKRIKWHSMQLNILPTMQFKTITMSVFIYHPIDESHHTPNALLPYVLRRGTKHYPESTQFRRRLAELYGAGFGFQVYKRGEYQVTQFFLDLPHDQYIRGAEQMMDRGLELLSEIIGEPVLENNQFRSSYVNAEKRSLSKHLLSILNNKAQYAAERCIQKMCTNEPFRLNSHGDQQKLQDWDENNLYSHYLKWQKQSPFEVYIIGDVNEDEIMEQLNKNLFEYRKGFQIPEHIISREEDRLIVFPRRVIETLDVQQAQVVLGMRSKVKYQDSLYPALLMYNGILGGFAHSKLFTEVREKNSLAYSVSSKSETHKGIVTIHAGVNPLQVKRAIALIEDQIEQMKIGAITHTEWQQTLSLIVHQLQSSQDSAFERMSFDFHARLGGRERSVQDIILELNQLNPTHVVEVAQGIDMDMMYTLTAK